MAKGRGKKVFSKLLEKRLKALLGDEYLDFLRSLDLPLPRSVRIHPDKRPERYAFQLGKSVPWCPNAYYLEGEYAFGEDPLWYIGSYYVQTASSMAIAPFVQWALREGVKSFFPRLLLDFAAAPGGKTTLLLDLADFRDVVVANEPHPERVNILVENVTKWGYPNCVITQSPPKAWERFSSVFDLILVDAPCSGEGLWRRSGYTSWSPGWVKKCVFRQRHILTAVVPLIKREGIFLYSTCTYEYEENEGQVNWLSSQWEWESVPIHVPDSWRWKGSEVDKGLRTYRLYPHRVEGEGFFLAPLVSKSANSETVNIVKKLLEIEIKPFSSLDSFLRTDVTYSIWGDQVVFATEAALRVATYLQERGIRVRQVGIPVLDLRYGTLMPHAFFSRIQVLNVPVYALSYEDAMSYLRGDIGFLNQIGMDRESEYVGFTYRGVMLGGVKKAGSRYRVLFPKVWSARYYL